ncbi:MAG: zinc metalloprotease HtpX [Actinobacteria bacterium]|nr:zinc metalloprotease HtpX [Actinomycetota bacterium]
MYEQIARNKRRTFLLLAVFVLLIAAVALALNYLIGSGSIIGVAIAIVVAIGLAWGSYFSSDKIALAVSRARPAEGPEYARYHNLVEGLCIAAGLPMPRLYVVDDPAPNAFSTGRNPKHAAVAVTTGLLQEMNRVELEGVLAHELSHIKNYDILVSTVAVTAVGAVALLADIGLRFMFWGGRAGRRDNNDAGALGAVIALAALALLVLAPFVAQLMQFAMSRRREYLADASGVELTRYPPGLISALEKLRDDQAVVHHATRATAQMWIEQPLDREEGKKGSWLNRAFDTHPPLEDRIKALKEM